MNFQVLRRTTATLAQKKGSVKDIQVHLRHAKADTTANEYMEELPESVKQMVDSVYGELRGGRKRAAGSVYLLRLPTSQKIGCKCLGTEVPQFQRLTTP